MSTIISPRTRSIGSTMSTAVGCTLCCAMLLAVTPTRLEAQAARLVVEPRQPSIEKGITSALRVDVLDASGRPHRLLQPLSVEIEGAETLTAVRQLTINAGESSATLSLQPREYGVWPVRLSAHQVKAANVLVSCPKPALIPTAMMATIFSAPDSAPDSAHVAVVGPPARAASAPTAARPNRPVAASVNAAVLESAGVRAARVPPQTLEPVQPLEISLPPTFEDHRLQQLMRAAVSRSAENHLGATNAEEQQFLTRFRSALQRADNSAGVRLIRDGGPTPDPRWVTNQVLVEGRAAPLQVKFAAQSEDTEGGFIEDGELRVMVAPSRTWPERGNYDEVEVTAFWYRGDDPARRVAPLEIRLIAESPSHPTLAPSTLTIASGSEKTEPASLTVGRPGSVEVKAAWFAQTTDPPEQVDFLPPIPTALRITGLPTTLRGIAKKQVEVAVELLSDTGDPASAQQELDVAIEFTGNSAPPSKTIHFSPQDSRRSATFELSEQGEYQIRASAASLGETTATLRYQPAWSALAAALIGGLLGAGFRLSQRSKKQRKKAALRIIAGGLFGAFLFVLLQFFSLLEKLAGLAPQLSALSELPALNIFAALLLGIVGSLAFEQIVGLFVSEEAA